MLCAKFQKEFLTKIDDMGEWSFVRFKFKIDFYPRPPSARMGIVIGHGICPSSRLYVCTALTF